MVKLNFQICLIQVIALFIILGLISCNRNCTNLNLKRAVDVGVLSEALAILDVDNTLLSCPIYPDTDSDIDDSTSGIPDGKWQPPLPGRALFSMFFTIEQYALCRDIYQDKLFLEQLKDIPEPDKQVHDWYEKRSRYNYLILPDGDHNSSEWDSLDYVQRKMATVFFNIKGWKFHATKMENDGFVIHGIYDSQTHIINLYKTSCKAVNIYGSNVGKSALSHRFYFIGAHEIGHSLDQMRGKLDNSTTNAAIMCEKRANIYGLLMTRGICRLFNGMTKSYKSILLTKNDIKLKQCDVLFINNIEEKWNSMEGYFLALSQRAKQDYYSINHTNNDSQKDWGIWGCLEKNAN